MNLTNCHKFLTELRENNSKDWMDAHRDWYQESRQEWISFVEELLEGLKDIDPSLGDLRAKDTIFRLNRDIRFSNNKLPYKTNFASAISEGGKKSGNPVYFVSFQPGDHFVGGGIYMPQPEALKKIRQEVDYNPEELKEIVMDEAFVNSFGEIQGEKLKTAPKGYPKDHPNIEFLRLKSFTAIKKISDKNAKQEDYAKVVLASFKLLRPLNEYLGVAIS